MAKLIKSDGTIAAVSPANGHDFKLEELYQLIGNGCDMVQMIRLAVPGQVMWLDEEGKYRKPLAEPNRLATVLLHEAGGIPSDYVVGNVLVCEDSEVE